MISEERPVDVTAPPAESVDEHEPEILVADELVPAHEPELELDPAEDGAAGEDETIASDQREAIASDQREAIASDQREAGGEEPEQHVIRLEEAAEALPAIARVAAGVWLKAAAWGVGTSLRVSARLARAAVDPGTATELYSEIAGGLRSYAREFLGISDLDDRMRMLTPLAGSTMREYGDRPELALRVQGEELLRQAADVGFQEGAHPAYARILTELAPDEARILRLLATEGPQAIVDVRAANLIGLGSQLIAPGLNMIGPQAGVRRRDRMPAYLNNIARLGLVHLSDEALGDPMAYQVLEAQPDVLSVIKETTRAKTIHRSLELSPFGRDFCEVCLPLDTPAGLLGPGSTPPQLPSGDVA